MYEIRWKSCSAIDFTETNNSCFDVGIFSDDRKTSIKSYPSSSSFTSSSNEWLDRKNF